MSLVEGGIYKSLEPASNAWDLKFTQYTFFFIEENTNYLVTGLLLNRNNTMAIMDEEVNYEDIDKEMAESYTLKENIDVPGYNWKGFSLDANEYTVYFNKNYIIRSSSGFYYKLRFLDWYNDEGEVGHAKFEYQKL